MRELRFFRCKTGPNFEIFQWESPDQNTQPPKNSDVGGHHLAFYVDDLDEAVAYLDSQGVELMGSIVESQNASFGQRWMYFLTPWGMQCELVSFPTAKPTKLMPTWFCGILQGRQTRDHMTLTENLRDGNAAQRIADSLREAILRGEYAPGDRIVQEDLTARYGGSRIPVREALRQLESDGLVRLVANTGAWVASLTLAECSEVYQTRERIEPLLLRFSAETLTREQLTRLDELAHQMSDSQEVEEFLELDRLFHLGAYENAKTHVLGALVTRLWNTTQPYHGALYPNS